MIDADFVAKLQELDALGKDGIPAMRELLRPAGQLSRLIALAARGVRKKAPRTPKPGSVKTRIADHFPDDDAKQKAVAYWNEHRRPDLVARLDQIAEAFHDHHHARGNSMLDWGAAWRTWYTKAINYEQPPRNGMLAAVSFEQTSIEGWVTRLEMFFGMVADVPKSTWSVKWGAPPWEEGCRVPQEARTRFAALYRPGAARG